MAAVTYIVFLEGEKGNSTVVLFDYYNSLVYKVQRNSQIPTMTCRKLTESSKNPLLVGAMRASQVWLALMCLMVLAGHCLPLDPHKAAKEKQKELEEQLKKRMEGLPDFPGADKEEYKRYWEEAVKNNPSK